MQEVTINEFKEIVEKVTPFAKFYNETGNEIAVGVNTKQAAWSNQLVARITQIILTAAKTSYIRIDAPFFGKEHTGTYKVNQ